MKNVLITHHVPDIFIQLATRYYHIKPERLARLVCDEFARNPPAEITITTVADPSVEFSDDGPIEVASALQC